MRGRPELAALPVVVFTSSSRPEDKVAARELGATEYIEKLQSMGRFREVVELVREKRLGARDYGDPEPVAGSRESMLCL